MVIMPKNLTSSVKAVNQASILKTIFYQGPVKRADIAARLSLTMPTITTNVNLLIRAGLVRELEHPTPAASNLGRRARPVAIEPQARFFIGLEMKTTRRSVCVMSWDGWVRFSESDDELLEGYADNMKSAVALLRRALSESGMTLEQVTGIGLGVPGLVNADDGELDALPSAGWFHKKLRDDLAAMTGYQGPIWVENNGCVRAYGVRLSQREELNDINNFAYFYIARGIACPFFLNFPNAIGSVVGAGEVGHMVLEPGGLQCTCGNRGCLEAYASNTAVIARCREALESGYAPVLREICPKPEELTMDVILDAQEAGDKEVCQILDKAILHIGIGMANLINFACPRMFFIDAQIFRSVKNQENLLSVIRRNLCNVIRTDTEYRFVEHSDISGATGAASLAISHFLEDPSLDL